jgi:hypothetical protein
VRRLGGDQNHRPRQPSECEQIVFFETPYLYHRSPGSGELQCKSRELEKAI